MKPNKWLFVDYHTPVIYWQPWYPHFIKYLPEDMFLSQDNFVKKNNPFLNIIFKKYFFFSKKTEFGPCQWCGLKLVGLF